MITEPEDWNAKQETYDLFAEIIKKRDINNAQKEKSMKEGEKKAFLPQWAIDEIEEILSTEVTCVPSNGDHIRFYTENLADTNYENEHHLLDIKHRDGKPYFRLCVMESKEGRNPIKVELVNNEVQELLCILLRQCLTEAEQWHHERKNAPSGEDFDPFLDSDDLP